MGKISKDELYTEYIVNGKSRAQISKEYGIPYNTVAGMLQANKIRRGNGYKYHGLSNTPLNIVWYGMKERCNNPNSSNYKWYGGRGISICKEWNEDFYSFYTWAINNGWEEGLELDRVDNSKDYCPENCKWITHKQQCRNRRTNKSVEVDGVSLLMCEWEERLGLKRKSLAKIKYRKGEEYMVDYIRGLCKNENKVD